MLRFIRENTLKKVLPAHPGMYTFYDKNKKLLYVGHARNLRHRIQSYREKDDFHTHPTKASLRPKIAYYAYQAMPVTQARAIEKHIKIRTRYNHL
jgi:excinuclease ABC subunit C